MRRGNGSGHVRAVPVLVDVGRILTRTVRILRARPVDERDVLGEVPGQPLGEVRLDVRVRAVDARVEDSDEHALVALLHLVGALDGRVHHLHVPLQVGERLGALDRAGRPRTARFDAARSPLALDVLLLDLALRRCATDRLCNRSPDERGRVRDLGQEVVVVDVTVATPIFLFSLTIFPPAAFTAARASAAETPDS